MIEKLYQANENKISSMIASATSFKFSSASHHDLQSFYAALDKNYH